jgi:hypothetical protein
LGLAWQRETATRQVEQEEQQVEKSAGDPLMRSSQLGRYLEKDLICCWQLPRVLWGKPTERAGSVWLVLFGGVKSTTFRLRKLALQQVESAQVPRVGLTVEL